MRMRTHAHGLQTMVKEINQTTNFYNIYLYWLMNLFICITLLYRQVFTRRVKEANETSELRTRSFITRLY